MLELKSLTVPQVSSQILTLQDLLIIHPSYIELTGAN